MSFLSLKYEAFSAWSCGIKISPLHALMLSLIVNEFISNALKHTFKDGKGQIEIRLGRVGDRIQLVMSDNGRGMKEKPKSGSQGMKILSFLVRQLGGELQMKNHPGLQFHIVFNPM